jgi:thymidylate kinase
MWIILEGPTAAGKSTLFREINDICRAVHEVTPRWMHKGQPAELTRRWALDEYVLSMENWYRPMRSHVLADRWAWGEITYAPIYRPSTNKDGYGLLGMAGWRWTEMYLMSRGALTVYVTADVDILIQRRQDRGDDHVTNDDDLRHVASLCTAAALKAPTCRVTHDTTYSPSSGSTAAGIVMTAALLAKMADRLDDYPEYIGAVAPTVLLVGDMRNEGRDGRYAGVTKLPFMPINGNSGDYLLRALPEPLWRATGLVNGNDIGDRFTGLHEALGHPPIVALGAQARAAVENAGVPPELVTTIHHPGYARRFKYGNIIGYGEAIASAAAGRKVEAEWLTR